MYVLEVLHRPHHLQVVYILTGKVTIFVTMRTTMQDVSGMVEIVVAAM